MILLLLLSLVVTVQSQAQYYCADQLQRCAVATSLLEREIMKIQTAAFESCVRRPSCKQERSIFDSCYSDAIRATRAPFTNDEAPEMFMTAAEDYRVKLDRCFAASPMPPRGHKTRVDEDTIYTRALLSTDLSDQLWGLPPPPSNHEDPRAVCRGEKVLIDTTSRIFGGGISRISDSIDPARSNLTTSCLIGSSEMECYRGSLAGDVNLQRLVFNRDYTMRACLQSVRLQTPCRNADISRVRTCICGVRAEFDRNMRAALLDCVHSNAPEERKSPDTLRKEQRMDEASEEIHRPAIPFAAAAREGAREGEVRAASSSSLSAGKEVYSEEREDPTRKGYKEGDKKNDQPVDISMQLDPFSRHRVMMPTNYQSLSPNGHMQPGDIINGRCMCTCASPSMNSHLYGTPTHVGGAGFGSPYYTGRGNGHDYIRHRYSSSSSYYPESYPIGHHGQSYIPTATRTFYQPRDIYRNLWGDYNRKADDPNVAASSDQSPEDERRDDTHPPPPTPHPETTRGFSIKQ